MGFMDPTNRQFHVGYMVSWGHHDSLLTLSFADYKIVCSIKFNTIYYFMIFVTQFKSVGEKYQSIFCNHKFHVVSIEKP